MNVAKTLERLNTSERATLAHAARDIGHELPRKRLANLANLRAGLAAIEKRSSSSDAFSSGYRTALLEVMAAFDAAASSQLRTDELLSTVRSRKWWPEILVTLSSGATQPSSLAASLGADASAVSRALAELRGLDLVEYIETTEGADARSRPHRLTLEGESIAGRLDAGTLVEKTAIEPVLRTAISMFTQLAIEDRMSLPQTEPMMRRAAGSVSGFVSSVLDKVLREFELSQRSWAQEVFLEKLEGWATHRQVPPELKGLFNRVTTKGNAVYVRCARTQQPLWDQLLGLEGLFPVGSRTISPADIDAGDVPKPQASTVSLFYDCLPILKSDLETQPEMQSLVEAAKSRFCVGPPGTTLPQGFELLQIGT